MPIESQKFVSGHCLILGNSPIKLSADKLKLFRPNIEPHAFGLFNVGAPDFNRFYPDVKPEDLVPEAGDYIYPVFRALSETIIMHWGGPYDFGSSPALKKSLSLLRGQTVYTNHETAVGNDVGVVYDTYWDAAFDQGGIKVPAGVNARTKIDGKSNPKLARSINSDPPSVHSTSVDVTFKWMKSHESLNDEEFMSNLGSYDETGTLIRKIVDDIKFYQELSFVYHGADTFAQQIRDGKIALPEHAAAAKFMEGRKFFYDWKSSETDQIKLSADPTIPNPSNNNINKNNEPMNEELLKFLRLKFGLPVDASEAVVKAKLQEMLPILLQAQTDLATRTTELGTANTELTALKAKYPDGTAILSAEDKTKLEDYPALKLTADEALTSIKQDALKLYNLTVGGADKADAAVTKLIAEANYSTAKALVKQYETLVANTHKLTCKSCGSTDVSRASSETPNPGIQHTNGNGGAAGTTPPVIKSNDEVLAHFNTPKTYAGQIHGKN